MSFWSAYYIIRFIGLTTFFDSYFISKEAFRETLSIFKSNEESLLVKIISTNDKDIYSDSSSYIFSGTDR